MLSGPQIISQLSSENPPPPVSCLGFNLLKDWTSGCFPSASHSPFPTHIAFTRGLAA